MGEELNFSGLGSKIYIGKMEDGEVKELQTVPLSESPTLSFGEDGYESKNDTGFTANFEVTIRESEEEKEMHEKEAEIIERLTLTARKYMDNVEHGIKVSRCHGRRRKAALRDAVRTLRQYRYIIDTAEHALFEKLNAVEDIDNIINAVRLEMGKTITVHIAMPNDPFHLIKVKLKVINGDTTVIK